MAVLCVSVVSSGIGLRASAFARHCAWPRRSPRHCAWPGRSPRHGACGSSSARRAPARRRTGFWAWPSLCKLGDGARHPDQGAQRGGFPPPPAISSRNVATAPAAPADKAIALDAPALEAPDVSAYCAWSQPSGLAFALELSASTASSASSIVLRHREAAVAAMRAASAWPHVHARA